MLIPKEKILPGQWRKKFVIWPRRVNLYQIAFLHIVEYKFEGNYDHYRLIGDTSEGWKTYFCYD